VAIYTGKIDASRKRANGKTRYLKNKTGIYRLTLMAFGSPPPSPDSECRHLDGDATNNSIDNLAWGTAKDNYEDRIRHGRPLRHFEKGENHPGSLLTEEQVKEIWDLRGKIRDREIADRFVISQTTIYAIYSGRLWKHLRPDNYKEILKRRLPPVRGEQIGMSKMTADAVAECRRLYAAGGISQRALAAQYSVSQGTIAGILSRRSWKHIR
jgi:hypothetical protein